MWKVENGKDVSFWMDLQLLDEPLINHALLTIKEENIWKNVQSFWTGSTWRYKELKGLLPPDIIIKLKSIRLRNDELAMDRFKWAKATDGIFTVRSFYQKAVSHTLEFKDDIWNTIWGVRVP